jgi:hypothetical protein
MAPARPEHLRRDAPAAGRPDLAALLVDPALAALTDAVYRVALVDRQRRRLPAFLPPGGGERVSSMENAMKESTMIDNTTMEIETMDQGALECEVHGAIYDMNARGETPSLAEVVRIIVGSRLRITGADAAWYRACATAHVVATVRGLLDVNPTQGQTVAEARAVARYYSDHAEALERFVREKQGQSDD